MINDAMDRHVPNAHKRHVDTATPRHYLRTTSPTTNSRAAHVNSRRRCRSVQSTRRVAYRSGDVIELAVPCRLVDCTGRQRRRLLTWAARRSNCLSLGVNRLCIIHPGSTSSENSANCRRSYTVSTDVWTKRGVSLIACDQGSLCKTLKF